MVEDLEGLEYKCPYCIVHDRSSCVCVKWRYKDPNVVAFMCKESGIIWHRHY